MRTISYGIEVDATTVVDQDDIRLPALRFRFSFADVTLVVSNDELDALPALLSDAIDLAREAARAPA